MLHERFAAGALPELPVLLVLREAHQKAASSRLHQCRADRGGCTGCEGCAPDLSPKPQEEELARLDSARLLALPNLRGSAVLALPKLQADCEAAAIGCAPKPSSRACPPRSSFSGGAVKAITVARIASPTCIDAIVKNGATVSKRCSLNSLWMPSTKATTTETAPTVWKAEASHEKPIVDLVHRRR